MQSQSSDELLSGDTNSFTASEFQHALRRIQPLHEPPCPYQDASGDTNSFTASEFNEALGRIRPLRQPLAPSHNASGDIDAPEAKLDSARRKAEPIASAAAAAAAAREHLRLPSDPATIRIVLAASSRGETLPVEVAPLGISETEQPRCIVLDAAAVDGGQPVRTLPVSQSEDDIGIAIRATPPTERNESKTGILHCRLYFDPHSDDAVILNLGNFPIIAKRVNDEASSGPGCLEPVHSTQIDVRALAGLETGCWMLYTFSGHHIFNLSVLPRQYVSIKGGNYRDSQVRDSSQHRKRLLDSSQPTVPAKTPHKTAGDTNSRDFVPQADSLTLLGLGQYPASAQPLAGQVRHVTSGICHPLEQLALGDTANIIHPNGKNYTLTRGENLMISRNSRVFRAQHSSISDPIVVKVIRTSLPVSSDTAHKSAVKIISAAESWLKESKNHSRLSQHASIVRLLRSDSRFLSLYMEDVNAPSLASYRDENEGISNCFCTLSVAEASRILADISGALRYIHSKGIVHNDIKPANILFSQTRGAVLIDFGLSSEISDPGIQTGGSPWYIPPEYAITGQRGAAGDVFALGVVMLFVLKKAPYPEMRQPRLHWIIADVRKTSAAAKSALESMSQWLRLVEQTSRELLRDDSSKLEWLAARMVDSSVARRITVGDLVKHVG